MAESISAFGMNIEASEIRIRFILPDRDLNWNPTDIQNLYLFKLLAKTNDPDPGPAKYFGSANSAFDSSVSGLKCLRQIS